MNQIIRSSILIRSLTVGAFLIAAFPTLRWYYQRSTDQSDEPLGLLALLAALYFSFQQRRQFSLRPSVIFAGSVLMIGIRQFTSLPPLVMAVMTLGVLLSALKLADGKAGITVLCVLSLPLLASLDFYGGYPMRLAAAELCHQLLHLIQIPVERSGALLMENHQIIGVDPPCSGVHMLWTSLFTAAVIAARIRLSAFKTLSLLCVTVPLVVVGNGLRATVLFFPESGRLHWPAWTHEGIGLVVHALVLLAIIAVSSRFVSRRKKVRESKGVIAAEAVCSRFTGIAAAVGLLCLLAFVVLPSYSASNELSSSQEAAQWPTMFDGERLIPLPLTERENRFLRDFPGAIARFQCGDKEIILRQVNRATRLLHPISQCLSASGHHLTAKPVFQDADLRLWGQHISQDTQPLRIRELIHSSDFTACYTDISSWYWSALFHPEEGPWTALTVIEPLNQ